MKRKQFLAAGFLGLFFTFGAASWAQDGVGVKAAQTPDLATPESALRTFLAAFSRADMTAAARCVVGGKDAHPDLLAFQTEVRRTKDVPRLTLLSLKATKEGETETELLVKVRLEVASIKDEREETVTLRREGDTYKIVPPLTPNANLTVAPLAFILSHPEQFAALRQRSEENTTLANVKQIAIALLTLTQNNNDKFAIKPGYFRQSVLRYAGSAEVLRSPLDAPGVVSYRFNEKLGSKSLSQIETLSNMVMIYEGEWKKPKFRYSGRAVIGFADGHVEMLSPEETKSLRWTP